MKAGRRRSADNVLLSLSSDAPHISHLLRHRDLHIAPRSRNSTEREHERQAVFMEAYRQAHYRLGARMTILLILFFIAAVQADYGGVTSCRD